MRVDLKNHYYDYAKKEYDILLNALQYDEDSYEKFKSRSEDMLKIFKEMDKLGINADNPFFSSFFMKILNKTPIMPLTGLDDEYEKINEDDELIELQNLRYDGLYKDIDKETGEVRYIYIDRNNRHISNKKISFPLTIKEDCKDDNLEKIFNDLYSYYKNTFDDIDYDNFKFWLMQTSDDILIGDQDI